MNGKEHFNFAIYSLTLILAGFVIAALGYRFSTGELAWICIGGGVGSLLPDMDHKNATLGKVFPIIPWLHKKLKRFKWYKGSFKHGGITHTVLINTWILIAAYIYKELIMLGIGIGYATHLYIDHVTGNKLPMLWWPIKTKRRR